jgi:hypothetical protein
MKVAENLSGFDRKARQLEGRINQPLTGRQLCEVAQEAAESYHHLAIWLRNKEHDDRDLLAFLTRKFSHIETEAMRRFYGSGHSGPLKPIL